MLVARSRQPRGKAGRGAGETLIGCRVSGVRVTPISGGLAGGGGGGGAATGALAGGELGDGGGGGGLGGTVATVGGRVADDAVGAVLIVVCTWVPCPPRELRDTRRTADTRIAMRAIPIAPKASIAGFLRYHGTGAGAYGPAPKAP
jgi:hypothetical protein